MPREILERYVRTTVFNRLKSYHRQPKFIYGKDMENVFEIGDECYFLGLGNIFKSKITEIIKNENGLYYKAKGISWMLVAEKSDYKVNCVTSIYKTKEELIKKLLDNIIDKEKF